MAELTDTDTIRDRVRDKYVEAARLLRPGGRFAVSDVVPHEGSGHAYTVGA